MLPGLGYRLRKELTAMLPRSLSVEITEWDQRDYMVWRGASILSDLHSFASQWISQQEYDEHGPRIVHRKCL